MTSRQRDKRAWPREAFVCDVGVLDDEDAARVLMDEAGGGERVEALALARRLGGLPLALRLAGRYLRSEFAEDSGFESYRQRLDADPRAIERIELDADDPEKSDRSTVMRTWELSLDALARHGLPEARPLLRLLSCFASPVPVPVGLLRPGVVLQFMREAVNQPNRATASVDRVLRPMLRLGLIDAADAVVDVESNGRSRDLKPASAVLVHPVIADTNRVHLLDPDTADPPEMLVRRTAVAVLATEIDPLSPDKPASWPRFRSLMSHLQAVRANSAHRLDDASLLVLARIMCSTAIASEQTGATDAAVGLVEAVMAETRRRDLELTPALSWARQQQAHLLGAVGRYGDAESIYREILSDQQLRWSTDDPANLVIRHNLARLAAEQGRTDEAESSLRGVVEEAWELLGRTHQVTLGVRGELATLWAEQSRWHEARTALREVLADAVTADKDDILTFVTRHNIAVLAGLMGEWDVAARLRYELSVDAESSLGNEHYITKEIDRIDAGKFLYFTFIGTSELRDQLAVDLLRRARSAAGNDQHAAAERIYADVIARYRNASSPLLREIVTTSYLEKAEVLGRGGRSDRARAISIYEELEDRFGGESDPLLRRLTADGLFQQAKTRYEHGEHREALRTAVRAEARYREIPGTDPEFHRSRVRIERLIEHISRAMALDLLHRGETMAKRGRHAEAVLAYDELLGRFGNHPPAALSEIVDSAISRRAISLSSISRGDAMT